MFYYIEPEVSGGFGENTVLNTSVHPPLVEKLHYQFDDWLGDDIITSFPCYIVTERLKMALEETDLTGFVFDDVEVTKSELFEDLNPEGLELPKFYWLKVNGIAGKDDFGNAADHRLVVSDEAMKIMQKCAITQADIEKY